MSLEAILAKITEDAESEARRILGEAEEERKRKLSEHSGVLEEKRTKSLERLKNRISEDEKRMEFHVQKDADRRVLCARRALMDDAVSAAITNLASLGDGDYLKLISALLSKTDLTGKVEVLISEGDSARITEKFLKKHSGSGTEFILSGDRHSENGGIILRSGQISQNGTFPMIAELSHEEMIMNLSSILDREETS